MAEIENLEYLEPNPGAMVESLRSIGYTLETAVADLIDNSITAKASRIDIDSSFQGSDTKIYILDNGEGMSEVRLVEAMRLGSFSPSLKRKRKDLGRFGLGLKTATFSQCKRLSVITKHEGKISARCWDLDFIIKHNKWCLLKDAPQAYIDKVSTLPSGTLVVWEKLDRIISDKDAKAEKNFNNKKGILRRHLSLVFHRFIEDGRLEIHIGGVPVEPWNPFLPHMNSSLKKELPPTSLYGGNVVIKGGDATPQLLHRCRIQGSWFQKRMDADARFLHLSGRPIADSRRLAWVKARRHSHAPRTPLRLGAYLRGLDEQLRLRLGH